MASDGRAAAGGRAPAIYLVEVYRPFPRAVQPADDRDVLGSIDIPGDRLTLFLVRANDAAAASRLLEGRGASVIRVTTADVQLTGPIDAPQRS